MRQLDALLPHTNTMTAPYHPPSATVSLLAHDDQPILMLEDIDHLLYSVTCTDFERHPMGKTIVLDFMDDVAFNEASEQWRKREAFTILTSHSACNADNEHGVWSYVAFALHSPPGYADSSRSIRSIMDDAIIAHRLTLIAERVTMREVVKSFAVKYEHAGARSWSGHDMQDLARRDSHDEGTLVNFDFSPTIDSRLALFPPNSSVDESVATTVIR